MAFKHLLASIAMLGLATTALAASQQDAYVRTDVQAFLKMVASRPKPEAGVQQAKPSPEQVAAILAAIDAPLGALAVDKTLTMNGPGGDIALRLFDVRGERAAGPVVVFYHGGGFVTGSIATHAALAAEMSRQFDLPVISVEYRLAPRHKWPAAPDDAEAAARWIAANGAAFGRSFDSLILSGDSAGGTLTLVTALALRDRPAGVPLKLLIALYPLTDASRAYPSTRAFADGYLTSSRDADYYTRAYAPEVKSVRHSPLLADLKGMPPTVLATASLDPLRDGGRAFAAKLIEAGVPVGFYEAAGNVHGFATIRKGIPSSQADLDRALALARTMLAKGQ